MKKITKASLNELRKKMPVLNPIEQNSIVGGGIVGGIKINGGYLVAYDYTDVGGGKYTAFQPEGGGQTIIFEDVLCSNSNVAENSAYQLNGTIHVSDSYANSGFSLENFIHEYGHYLQQQQYGNSTYLVNIAIPSVISGTINSDDHYKQWYEEDATKRGNEYVNGSGFGSNY